MSTEIATSAPATGATATESLAGLFLADIQAEKKEAAPEPAAPQVKEPEPDQNQAEPDAEQIETDSPDEGEVTAEEAETESEPEEAPAKPSIEPPGGMSEADKAVFAKLSPELQGWVSKRMNDQQADYTRKTQDVAERRKVVDQASQALLGRLQHYDGILAKFTDPEIQAPDPRLRDQDPEAYEQHLANYVHRKDLAERARRERSQVQAEMQAAQQKQMREFYAREAEELQRLAPDLAGSGEPIMAKRKAIHDYGVKNGYTPEMLAGASAKDIVTLRKAMLYDAAQAAKANIKTVPKVAPKVAHPGQAKNVGRPSDYLRAVDNLKRSPSVDSLEEAFLAELKTERR